MRRGLGLGRGKGYRNIQRRDSLVHSLSAKGMKQPQRVSFVRLPMRNVNRLPVQVGIIVPSTEYSKKISDKDFNKRVEDESIWLSKNFGGETSVESAGGYVKDGKLIEEKGKWVYSSMTQDDYEKFRKKVSNHVKQRQKDWKQYQILMKVEGVDFFVPKDKDMPDDKKLKSIPVG